MESFFDSEDSNNTSEINRYCMKYLLMLSKKVLEIFILFCLLKHISMLHSHNYKDSY